jgi:hypothetical protein
MSSKVMRNDGDVFQPHRASGSFQAVPAARKISASSGAGAAAGDCCSSVEQVTAESVCRCSCASTAKSEAQLLHEILIERHDALHLVAIGGGTLHLTSFAPIMSVGRSNWSPTSKPQTGWHHSSCLASRLCAMPFPNSR